GVQSRRHGIAQVVGYGGDILYDFQRDEPAPARVLSEQATTSMNRILTNIPYNGTARRAAVDGVLTGGKTGTSQSYRDAWFVGFTGNYTAAVWFGNDDYTPMNDMTGGSLPAMTFKKLMDYAHQGIELKPIPGIENPFPESDKKKETVVAEKPEGEEALPPLVRPRSMSAESTRVLRRIADSLKKAAPLVPATAKVADATVTGSVEAGPAGSPAVAQ
ncbi:MAG TPA: penicillin-binding transpeptidase domain-containing protein, partial [Pseudorhizobium sp.]|nr:penicillin-binding transpeptidase domain-containing protein [Pseudorhizobium sp.]